MRRLNEATHSGLPQRSRWRSFGLTVAGMVMVACEHAMGAPGPAGGFSSRRASVRLAAARELSGLEPGPVLVHEFACTFHSHARNIGFRDADYME